MYNTRNMGKNSLCNTKRKIGLKDVRPKDKPEFIRTRITRAAVNNYKLAGFSYDEVNTFIEEEMQNIPCVSELTRKLQMDEIKTIVFRYITADSRRAKHYAPKNFMKWGEEFTSCPDFIYVDTVDSVQHVEVVDFTTGRQKFITGKSRDKEVNSLTYSMEGFGLLMYGISLLTSTKGKVTVAYDALKTTRDKNGDYSEPWQESVEGKKSKMTDNRASFTVDVENGIITTPAYADIMAWYKETFLWWLKGKDTCSKDTCSKCELNELCHYNHRPVTKEQQEITKSKVSNLGVSKEQQDIIDFEKGICLVDAGPGSGKSHSVAMRIAKLLSKGVKPEDIILISFSRAAIKVLVDRVKLIVDEVYDMPVDTSKIKIASFNSLGNEIIKKYYKDLGFNEEPTLCDGIEQYDLVLKAIDWEDEIEGLDYRNPNMEFNANVIGAGKFINRQIETIRNGNMSADEYFDYARDILKLSDESIVKIWETYERFKKLMVDKNFIDYSDQSNLVENLIDEAPEYVTEVMEYQHIVVDEFQDSNDFQLRLLMCLMETGKFKSLMVVGDESQSIFGFRGTSPENIVNFGEKIGEKVEVKYLSTNYRSTEEIVTCCNDYIQLNGKRHKMKSGKGASGNKPILKGFATKKDEIAYIVSRIKTLIEDGAKPEEIAVICGKRSTLKAISKALSEIEILSQYDMPEYMLDNSRVLAAIGFAEFVSDNTATKGLLDYLNEIYNFLDSDFNSNINKIIEDNKTGFIEVWEYLETDEEKKDFFLKLLNLLNDGTDNIYSEFVEKVANKTTYSITDLLSYIIKMKEYSVKDTGEKEGEYEAVSLVTAHSSKGKEWKYVFGSLSDFQNQGISLTEEETCEKRRLIYVMMSRAKDFLTVTSVMTADTKSEEAHQLNWFYKEIRNLDCFAREE